MFPQNDVVSLTVSQQKHKALGVVMQITAAVSRDGADAPVLETVELEAPRAGEILVRIATAGICHTDLRAHQGGVLPTQRPVVLGHEGAGVVLEVGSGVAHVKQGDRVVLSGSSCGRCRQCASQLPSYCVEGMPRSFGGKRGDGTTAISAGGNVIGSHFFGQSSFATHSIADASGAVKIGDDVPFEVASPLGCGVITGAGAVINSFGLRAGQSIVVFGAGGVGLSAVMAARIAGAPFIAVVEPVAQRRTLALELGAQLAIDPTGADVPAQLRKAAPGGVDFALNTTTLASALLDAQRCLAARGVLGFVSATREPFVAPLFPLLVGGQSLRGIVGGDSAPQRFIPILLEYWRQGRFPVDKLVTPFPFADIATAFAACRSGVAVKPVLKVG
jgi:aryl-alcohol dehydrogenase